MQNLGVSNFFALTGWLEAHHFILQLVEDDVSVFERDAPFVGGPFLVDDNPRVVAQHRFEAAAQGLGVAVEVAVETAKGGRFGRHDGVDFGVVFPGRDGDQSQGQTVKDPHDGEEKAHDIVMLGAVPTTRPTIGRVMNSPASGNATMIATTKSAQRPVRQVVDPVDRHKTGTPVRLAMTAATEPQTITFSPTAGYLN